MFKDSITNVDLLPTLLDLMGVAAPDGLDGQSVLGWLFTFVLLTCMFAIPVMGQTTTGSIYGAVNDSTGAVIPNATVTVKNVQTGETHSAVSNATGNYLFPTLDPGDYMVSAMVQGFKTQTQKGIRLDVTQSLHVEFTLQVGAQDQTVTVDASTTQVDTRESQLGETVEQKRIQDLPLNGRNVYDLVQILPGVTHYNAGAVGGDSTGTLFQVNGMRQNANSFYLDGVFDNALFRQGGNTVPNPDAIQEFRLLTSNFDAEYGREPGGVVNSITRSGSNQFHGVAYDYLRNTMFNAKNYFETSVTSLHQNQFGGAFGGPILHDKLFFFGSYEQLIRHTPAVVTQTSWVAPTALEATGDFSQSAVKPKYKTVGATGQVIGNYYTCGGVVGKICPGGNGAATANNLLDPVAMYILKTYVPTQNPATRLPPQQEAPANVGQKEYVGRVDYQATSKHKISGTYFTSRAATENPIVASNKIITFSGVANTANQTNAVGSDTWIISSNKVNSLRVYYALNHYDITTTYKTTWVDYGSPIPQAAAPLTSQPLIDIKNYWSMGAAGYGPNDQTMQTYGMLDTLNWTRGNHTLKLGGSFLWNMFDNTATFLGTGKLSFTGVNTAGNAKSQGGTTTGNALADFELGQAATFEQNNGVNHHIHEADPAIFAQDDWKLTKRLTLNLGVRYELFLPYTGQNNTSTFVQGVQSTRFPTAPLGLLSSGDIGVPDGTLHTPWKKVAPRFGFAYDVYGNGKTSLRGAYGVFYAAPSENLSGVDEQQPFLLDYNVSYTPNLETPYGATADPFPYNVSTPTFTPGAKLIGLKPYTNDVPYVQEYNLTVQQQLGAKWSSQIAYVGNAGRKFYLLRDQNSPAYIPGAAVTSAGLNARRPIQALTSTGAYVYGQISQYDSAGNSFYNSLQLTIRGTFAPRSTILASYVWARNIDFVGADPTANLQLVNENNIAYDKGLDDNAQPERFVVSYIYTLPDVRFLGHFGKEVLGGWQINGITVLTSGSPFTITSGVDSNLDGNTNDRPNQVGNPIISGSRTRAQKIKQFFNQTAFVQVPAGVPYGNVGRASLLGPRSVNTDLSLFKSFALYREHALQVRAEAFNAINNVNLDNPNGVLTNKKFGTISGAGSPRILQFALKYVF